MIIQAGIPMFQLQALPMMNFFTKNTVGLDTKYIIIGIVVIIVAIVIYNIAKGNFSRDSDTDGSQFSGLFVYRETKDMGFSREQIKMLEYILRSGGIKNPERLLNSPDLLDRHFKRTYRLIERTSANNEELNQRLSVLFSTRDVIESHLNGVPVAPKSDPLLDEAPAVLVVDKVNYPVKVISTHGDTLVVGNPKTSGGELINLPKGSKATLTIFTKSTKGVSVNIRVMDSSRGINGPVLHLAHSGKFKELSKRRFKRRDTDIPAYFYKARIDDENNTMVVDKQQFAGNLSDISIGGCSIKTSVPIVANQQLKIEFTYKEDLVAALGEVLRISPDGPAQTTMHIKFLKIPRQALNLINAIVYDNTNKDT